VAGGLRARPPRWGAAASGAGRRVRGARAPLQVRGLLAAASALRARPPRWGEAASPPAARAASLAARGVRGAGAPLQVRRPVGASAALGRGCKSARCAGCKPRCARRPWRRSATASPAAFGRLQAQRSCASVAQERHCKSAACWPLQAPCGRVRRAGARLQVRPLRGLQASLARGVRAAKRHCKRPAGACMV